VSTVLEHACELLADALRAAAPELTAVEVVQAPPDGAATYPAAAILPERFKLEAQGDEEVTDEDGDPIMVDATTALMEVGSLRGTARLWVAARYPAQRALLEEKLRAAFFDDDLAPSRLLVTLENVEVLGVATGASWPVAFLLDTSEWRDEMVFSERRWSFIQLRVDVPVLIHRRNAALVTQLIAALTTDLNTTVDDPADVAVPPLTNLELVTVADDGTVGPSP
jgi:hypothetical protein